MKTTGILERNSLKNLEKTRWIIEKITGKAAFIHGLQKRGYATVQKNNHFMDGAKTLFNTIAKFFGFACETDGDSYYGDLRAQKYYYIRGLNTYN